MSGLAVRARCLPHLFLIVLLTGGCTLSLPEPHQAQPTSEPVVADMPSSTPGAIPGGTTAAPAIYPGAPPVIDLPNVILDVELFYSDRWMRVYQVVDVPNETSDTWSEVVFSVPINYTPDAFALDSLKVTQGDTVQEGLPSLYGQETMLHVPLPRPLQPGETVQIEIGYRVIFPPVAPTDWPPIGTTGWTENIIQAGEWYPSLVPYVNGVGWQTWRYHPVGDPTIYPLTTINLTVTTQENVVVASGGLLDAQDGVWRFQVNAARGIAFLASTSYKVTERDFSGISLSSYYLEEHAWAGEAALDIAENAIKLFSEIYGPYPYRSLTIAENGFFGGMEYSELISITDYCYHTYQGQPDSIMNVLVAHETAHQWWYGAVGNDQANEPWLDESLAFYGELLYFERYHPDYVDWWWEKRVDVYDPYGPVDATIYSYERSEYFIPSMYGQAARFVRDLRKIMGDEKFFAFLKDYYTTYRWKTVTAQDFVGTVREHYDGDLTPLLKAYFSRTDW